jgi:hypothetical protein
MKSAAERWFDAHYLPPQELPDPLPQPLPVAELEDLPGGPLPFEDPFELPKQPHSTRRPARALMKGDDVFLAGEWLAIVEPPEPVVLRDMWLRAPIRCMRLTFTSGLSLEPRYEALLLSRDADEQALAAAGAVCDDVG